MQLATDGWLALLGTTPEMGDGQLGNAPGRWVEEFCRNLEATTFGEEWSPDLLGAEIEQSTLSFILSLWPLSVNMAGDLFPRFAATSPFGVLFGTDAWPLLVSRKSILKRLETLRGARTRRSIARQRPVPAKHTSPVPVVALPEPRSTLLDPTRKIAAPTAYPRHAGRTELDGGWRDQEPGLETGVADVDAPLAPLEWPEESAIDTPLLALDLWSRFDHQPAAARTPFTRASHQPFPRVLRTRSTRPSRPTYRVHHRQVPAAGRSGRLETPQRFPSSRLHGAGSGSAIDTGSEVSEDIVATPVVPVGSDLSPAEAEERAHDLAGETRVVVGGQVGPAPADGMSFLGKTRGERGIEPAWLGEIGADERIVDADLTADVGRVQRFVPVARQALSGIAREFSPESRIGEAPPHGEAQMIAPLLVRRLGQLAGHDDVFATPSGRVAADRAGDRGAETAETSPVVVAAAGVAANSRLPAGGLDGAFPRSLVQEALTSDERVASNERGDVVPPAETHPDPVDLPAAVSRGVGEEPVIAMPLLPMSVEEMLHGAPRGGREQGGREQEEVPRGGPAMAGGGPRAGTSRPRGVEAPFAARHQHRQMRAGEEWAHEFRPGGSSVSLLETAGRSTRVLVSGLDRLVDGESQGRFAGAVEWPSIVETAVQGPASGALTAARVAFDESTIPAGDGARVSHRLRADHEVVSWYPLSDLVVTSGRRAMLEDATGPAPIERTARSGDERALRAGDGRPISIEERPLPALEPEVVVPSPAGPMALFEAGTSSGVVSVPELAPSREPADSVIFAEPGGGAAESDEQPVVTGAAPRGAARRPAVVGPMAPSARPAVATTVSRVSEWTARLLEPRGVAPEHVREQALDEVLGPASFGIDESRLLDVSAMTATGVTGAAEPVLRAPRTGRQGDTMEPVLAGGDDAHRIGRRPLGEGAPARRAGALGFGHAVGAYHQGAPGSHAGDAQAAPTTRIGVARASVLHGVEEQWDLPGVWEDVDRSGESALGVSRPFRGVPDLLSPAGEDLGDGGESPVILATGAVSAEALPIVRGSSGRTGVDGAWRPEPRGEARTPVGEAEIPEMPVLPGSLFSGVEPVWLAGENGFLATPISLGGRVAAPYSPLRTPIQDIGSLEDSPLPGGLDTQPVHVGTRMSDLPGAREAGVPEPVVSIAPYLERGGAMAALGLFAPVMLQGPAAPASGEPGMRRTQAGRRHGDDGWWKRRVLAAAGEERVVGRPDRFVEGPDGRVPVVRLADGAIVRLADGAIVHAEAREAGGGSALSAESAPVLGVDHEKPVVRAGIGSALSGERAVFRGWRDPASVAVSSPGLLDEVLSVDLGGAGAPVSFGTTSSAVEAPLVPVLSAWSKWSPVEAASSRGVMVPNDSEGAPRAETGALEEDSHTMLLTMGRGTAREWDVGAPGAERTGQGPIGERVRPGEGVSRRLGWPGSRSPWGLEDSALLVGLSGQRARVSDWVEDRLAISMERLARGFSLKGGAEEQVPPVLKESPAGAWEPTVVYSSDPLATPQAGSSFPGSAIEQRIDLGMVAAPRPPPVDVQAADVAVASRRVARRRRGASPASEPAGPSTWASIAQTVNALADSLKQKAGIDVQGLSQGQEGGPLPLSLLAAGPVRKDAAGVAEGVYMQPERPEPEERGVETPVQREAPEDVDVWGMEQVVAELRWRMRLQERWDSELE